MPSPCITEKVLSEVVQPKYEATNVILPEIFLCLRSFYMLQIHVGSVQMSGRLADQ